MTATLAANSQLSRAYSAPASRGSIAAGMAAPFRFGLMFAACERASVWLDDPVTFAINEDHTKVSRTGQHIALF
jgi:hypothetical protein